jgi:predicted aspartyl protease
MQCGVYRSPVLLTLVALAAAGCGRNTPTDDIAVRIVNNLVLVPVQVNGSTPLTFILDTGASSLVVDARRVAELKLATGASGDARTGGGSVEASAVENVSFRAGKAELAGASAVAINLAPLDAALGTRIDGILGYEFFARYVVQIDYPAARLRVFEPDAFRDDGGHAVMPITFEEQLPIARVTLRRADGGSADATLEVDTGLTGSLTLTRAFVDAHRLIAPEQPRVRITTGALLPGQVAAEVVRVPHVTIGAADIDGVIANVNPTEKDAGVQGKVVGLLGGDLLRRFLVTIDYSRSRILLEPNALLLEPDEFDMTGMSLIAPEPQAIAIRTIIPGSPAAEVGLMPGDRLVAIDGRGTAQMTLSDIRAMFQREKVTYVLLLKRGDGTREVRITTKRLV